MDISDYNIYYIIISYIIDCSHERRQVQAMKNRRAVEARFMKHVIYKEPGHWIWSGAVMNKSREVKTPAFKLNGKSVNARSAAFEIFCGDRDDTLRITFGCGNDLCVSPDHLKVISAAEHSQQGKQTQIDHWKSKPLKKCGHPNTPENRALKSSGGLEQCRICKNRRSRDWKRAQRKKSKEFKDE